ncbi:protein Fe65 homolog isoform X2 [Gigantopelta aegis]|uniref:protein Fe65 homolog isoform X2 n=1 Tax=Gigantopelta aegis TaxID=1735272 RepID=UPI001B88C7A2|nr:protein Fe65 homolog isoform X2 [Gigantopelta aegis]
MAETPTSPTDDTDPTYLSFSNPNYNFPDAALSFVENEDNNNQKINKVSSKEQQENYANLEFKDLGTKTSVTSPQSPDHSIILNKLNSPSSGEKSKDETYGGQKCKDEDCKLLEDGDKVKDTYLANKPIKSSGFLNYYSQLEAKARERECTTTVDNPDSPDDGFELAMEERTPAEEMTHRTESEYPESTVINSPDSNDSGIHSDTRSDDGMSHGPGKQPETRHNGFDPDLSSSDDTDGESLPTGWEKCEDDNGAYYWHIKSGTIQRDPPTPEDSEQTILRSKSVSSDENTVGTESMTSSPTSIISSTEEHLQEFEGHALQYAAKSLQSLQSLQNSKADLKDEACDDTIRPVRFAVQSLGWVSIAEEDLTPERSSKAVNRCIVDLSLGRNDINDVVGRWGDGKDLYMDLDSMCLRLVDTQDLSLLHYQPIHSIRVWGVGRDNGRDFAYVARDKTTQRHMCHVFRCDVPARQIANTLRDICKKLMVERTTMQKLNRPTDLPNLEKVNANGQKMTFQSLYNNTSFPTPMEEPKKDIRCHYLGTQLVCRPTGTDIVNEAIERACRKVPPEKWQFVCVSVAPSTVTITEHKNPETKLQECRVRFLSFMGIALENVKLCAYIMHDAQDKFVAHIFHCEPSAGPLCKTIEAACKLRYQKALDSHKPQTPTTPSGGKGLGAALKAGVKASVQSVQNVIGILKTKKAGQC